MRIEFDALNAYPVDELVYLRVALPKELIAEIDDALAYLPAVKTRERFVAFAALFALADIQNDTAASLDRS
jgi:hypothetical protein